MDLAIIITIVAAAVLLGGLAMLMIRRYDLHAAERRELELREAIKRAKLRSARAKPVGERAARVDPDFARMRSALQAATVDERKIRAEPLRPVDPAGDATQAGPRRRAADHARGRADGSATRARMRATDDTRPPLADDDIATSYPTPPASHHDAGPGPSWGGYSGGGYSSGGSDSGSSGGSGGGGSD